jgi:hypothetical protein
MAINCHMINNIKLECSLNTDLLEQELGSIRNRQLRHFFGAFAVGAPAIVPHQTALLTCVHLELVRGNHETLKKKLCCAIANETVSLHFSQPKTAFA